MLIPHQQARNLVIVDPRTGLQIPHVQGADPDLGFVIIPRTTYAVVPMIITEAGVSREVPYTFVIISSGDGSGRAYSTWSCRCRFDIVHKETGEVLHEIEGPDAPLEITDPATYCQRHNPDNYDDPGQVSVPPRIPVVPESADHHSSYERPPETEDEGGPGREPHRGSEGPARQPGEDQHPQQVLTQDRQEDLGQHQNPRPSPASAPSTAMSLACPIWSF